MTTKTDAPNLTDEVEDLKTQVERQNVLIEKALSGAQATSERIGPTTDERITKALEEGFRCFVAPAHKNSKFLARPGKFVRANPAQGRPLDERDGDIWVEFTGGYVILGDPDAISWCEERPHICRDVMDPKTEAWAALIEGQLNTSTRQPSIPTTLDVDAVLRGEVTELGQADSLVSRARAALSGAG